MREKRALERKVNSFSMLMLGVCLSFGEYVFAYGDLVDLQDLSNNCEAVGCEPLKRHICPHFSVKLLVKTLSFGTVGL